MHKKLKTKLIQISNTLKKILTPPPPPAPLYHEGSLFLLVSLHTDHRF